VLESAAEAEVSLFVDKTRPTATVGSLALAFSIATEVCACRPGLEVQGSCGPDFLIFFDVGICVTATVVRPGA
jgi:hypothetical protein